MGKQGSRAPTEPIADLELVEWVDESSSMRGLARRGGIRVGDCQTFHELYDAITEHGPVVIANRIADVIILAISGRFDGHLMAVRQSGRNVRRFLIRHDLFEDQFGTVPRCISHLLSNNTVGFDIEINHLRDVAESLGLSAKEFDSSREYDRFEVDLVAALQLLEIEEANSGDLFGRCSSFELGFCVGRLFSSIQNMATLEPEAAKAAEYLKAYRERGRKGKSKNRKIKRLDQLFARMALLVEENPAFARLNPKEVGRLAIHDVAQRDAELWSQGKGQLEQYLTVFASDERYQRRYRKMFPKTG